MNHGTDPSNRFSWRPAEDIPTVLIQFLALAQALGELGLYIATDKNADDATRSAGKLKVLFPKIKEAECFYICVKVTFLGEDFSIIGTATLQEDKIYVHTDDEALAAEIRRLKEGEPQSLPDKQEMEALQSLLVHMARELLKHGFYVSAGFSITGSESDTTTLPGNIVNAQAFTVYKRLDDDARGGARFDIIGNVTLSKEGISLDTSDEGLRSIVKDILRHSEG